jgi:hypothetical protein
VVRRTHLAEIEALDPGRDYRRIVWLDTCHEFPWDTARALELALFRTFAAPSISAILDRTGEFRERAQRRYDDTDLILSEILEHGFDDPRGREAIRHMNRLHGAWSIPNEDMLYVLSTFVLEPGRWIERFGWRRVTDVEKAAALEYWRHLARFMHVTGVPATYEELETFNREYEGRHFRRTAANRRVADATLEMFAGWYLPGPLRPLARPFIYALLDDPLREALGYPRPPRVARWLAVGGLRARAVVVRRLPERRRPVRRTQLRRRSYPTGYRVEELGASPSTGTPNTPSEGHEGAAGT